MTRRWWPLIACTLLVPVEVAAQNLTVTSSGVYVLTANSVSGGLFNVVIEADDVTLDLNGKTVRCAPADPGTAVTFGIYASGRSRITIKNGIITGCLFGINGGSSAQLTVEDVTLSGNTYIGAEVGGAVSSVFRRVTCDGIAGYIVEAYAVCINGLGVDGLVEDSHFLNLYRQPAAAGIGEGVGVLVGANATGVMIRRNQFRNERLDDGTFGIWGGEDSGVTVVNNAFVNIKHAVAVVGTTTVTHNTLALEDSIGGSTAIVARGGAASGNTISPAYEVKLDGVTDGGNTVSEPRTDGQFFRMCVDGTCFEGTLYPKPGIS